MGTVALAHRGRDAAAAGAGAGDDQLVAAVRRGDDGAFERLYGRYRERVCAYVTRIVGCRDHAEEICQDAFVSALRRLRSCDQAIAFKPWIYGIARNAAIDHLRARARRGPEVGFDQVQGLIEAAPAGTGAPDDALAGRQALRDLRGAFGALSAAHHEILVMRELEGLSYDQIGTRLGLTRSQVESTLFRARRRLEAEYAELVSGERCRRVQAIILGGERHAVGVRDQRRVERHLAHCHSCRRQAVGTRQPVAAA